MKYGVGGELYDYPGPPERQTSGSWSKLILKLSGGKMEKLKLSCLLHIMRWQDSLEKTIMLGKIEGSRKRGRPNMRWIDSVKEAIGMSL